MSAGEKILLYLGPSLPLYKAVELVPNAIFRPPARQSDILSDVVEIQPDYVLLVDGEFLQNLSVWHKEIVFALSKGIKVYGASSMGALRAADLWRQGMIGYGKIFEWYRNGITEDDAEVALLYTQDTVGNYQSLTVPLVNVRATLNGFAEMLGIVKDHQEQLLLRAKDIKFAERYPQNLQETWTPVLGERTAKFLVDNLIDQKAFDAEDLLTNFRSLEPAATARAPDERALSKFFWAQYDRDRKVRVPLESGGSARIRQAAIDGHIALTAVDYPQIFWDAKNFYLTNMLAEKLSVRITVDDVNRERDRFIVRHGIKDLEQWRSGSGLTEGELQLLIIRMARVRKLQTWLASTLVPMEMTKLTLDYLKAHNAYDYWAREAASAEQAFEASQVDETMCISPSLPNEVLLAEHVHQSGITIDGTMDEYISETGFGSRAQLGVALFRIKETQKE